MDRSKLFPQVYRAETVVIDTDNKFRTVDDVILKNRKRLLFLEYQVMRCVLKDIVKPSMDRFIEYGTSSLIDTLEEFENFIKRYDILISRFNIEFILA